jgi:hypothetical protein
MLGAADFSILCDEFKYFIRQVITNETFRSNKGPRIVLLLSCREVCGDCVSILDLRHREGVLLIRIVGGGVQLGPLGTSANQLAYCTYPG